MDNPRELQLSRAFAFLGFVAGMIVGLGLAETLYHAYLAQLGLYRWFFPSRNLALHLIVILSSGALGLALSSWGNLGEISEQADGCRGSIP